MWERPWRESSPVGDDDKYGVKLRGAPRPKKEAENVCERREKQPNISRCPVPTKIHHGFERISKPRLQKR